MVQTHRVLVADDNRDAADSLAILLRMWSHDVRVAYDGRSAVNVAWDFLPDVLFLDIQMPGMHGGEVARYLRTLPEFRQARIVATSANEPDDPRLATWRHYFDGYFVKPYSLTQLEEALAHGIRCDL
jgi:CheY-like chemotaxis protein